MRDLLDDIDSVFEERERRQAADREQNLFRAAATDPDRKAKVLRIAESTGVPSDVVDRNLDDASRITAASESSRALDAGSSPVLRAWVAMHEDHAALVRDDVETLRDLEPGFKGWLQRQVDWAIGKWRIDSEEAGRPAPELGIGSSLAAAKVGFPGLSAPARFLERGIPQRAWESGVAQLEQSKFGVWAAGRRLDPDEVPRIRELDGLIDPEVGARDPFLKKSVAQTTGILPGMLAAWTEGTALSAMLSGTTLKLGGPALAPTVPAVALAGFLAGSAWSTYKQEAGSAYIETVREMKARGGPVDLDAAANSAIVAGTINAAFETIPQLVLVKYFPGLKRLIVGKVTRTAREALTKATVPRAVAKGVWAGAAVTGSESLTESAQRGITAGFREVAIDRAGGPTEYGRIPDEMLDEFLGAAQAMWLLGLPGIGGTFHGEFLRVRDANRNRKFMENVAETVRKAKLAQRSPEKLADLVEKISESNAGPAFVYVPAEAWNTYWQSQEVDPADAAREITGSDQAYREAVQLGADVAVPFSAWVSRVAPTDHFVGLIDDAKLDVGGMSYREASAKADEALGFAKEVLGGVAQPTELEEGARTIYDVERAKALDAGRSESEADAYGKIQAAFWGTRARRMSTPEAPVSALSLWKQYRVEVAPVDAPSRTRRRRATAVASPFVEDLRTPEDVPRWIRANGGLLADQRSELKAGTKETRDLPTNLLNYKTGHRIRWFAEKLVEGGYFEDDRAASDWIYDAITNPTGLSMPRDLGSPSDAEIAREGTERHEAMLDAEVEQLGEKAAELGVSARARQVLEEALRTGAHFEEVEAFDLKPGEIVEHDGDIYKVTFPDPGEPPVLVDGVEKELGYEQRISVVRLGMPGQRLEQSAFHGSPHRFDRFDVSKIGTGQGAQAYGWGLYFAGKREVAEYYRESSSDYEPVVGGERIEVERGSVEDAAVEWMADAVDAQSSAPYQHAAQRLQRAKRDASRSGVGEGWTEPARRGGKPTTVVRSGGPGAERQIAFYDAVLDVLAEWESRGVELRRGGQIYRVEIPEDDQFLDWDRPISEQSEHVKAALQPLLDKVIRVVPVGDRFGLEFKHADGIALVAKSFATRPEAEAAARRRLVRLGASTTGQDLYNSLRYQLSHPLDVELADPGVSPSREVWNAAAQNASERLRDIGIAGIRYLDEGSRVAGSGTSNYVVFTDDAARIEETYYQQAQYESGGRGFVRIPAGTGPREFFVGLVRALANRSTLFHETGHVYLEVLADHAEMAGAPEEIRQDWQAILQFLGVANRSEIATEHHERFARAFERYLGEGKAPSAELVGVFARFRAWLVQIYRTLSALRVELDPEIRGVFDRMLATDAEIHSAERAQAYEPLENLRDHMSTAEREEYDRATREAREDAVRQLDVQLQADSVRELKEWFRVERRRLLEEVQAELAADRGYRALAWLQRGKMLDGAEAPAPLLDADGRPLKIAKAALVELYGEDFVESIPKRIRPYVYQVEGGLHPDVVAAAFGFRAGDEMIRQLGALTPIRTILREEVAKRMREQYGDLLHEKDRLAEEAMLATHSEARVAQMILELRAIERRIRKGYGSEAAEITPLNLRAFQDLAEGAMRARKVAAVLPHVWQNGEFLAREGARTALQQGKLATAYTQQINAIKNFYMYRAALEARRTIRSQVRDLERTSRESALRRVGLGAPGAREQIEGILERFGFMVAVRPRSESLHSWASNAESTWGDDISIDDRLFDEKFSKHFRELTTEELDAVWGAVQNIRTLARRRNQVLTEGRMVALDTAVAEMIGQAETLPERVKDLLDPNTRTLVESWYAGLITAVSMVRTMQSIVRKLDGGKIDGPFHRYIWNPIKDARAKSEELENRVAEKFLVHLAAMGPKIRNRLQQVVHIPEIPDPVGRGVTRAWIIGVALNAGNEGNRHRLSAGNGLDDSQIQVVLEHLTEEELDWVQGVIDSFEGLWPEIRALHERTTGAPPEKVAATPFTVRLADGRMKTYRGGYFPIVYDPAQSNAGRRQEMKTPGEVFSGAYWRPGTNKGHTKARVQEFARPLLLDVRHVPGKMAQVIHDLAFREAVTSVAKIVLNEPLQRVLRARLGEGEAKLFLPWLQDIANDRAWSVGESLRDLDKAADFIRAKTTVAIMAFKATILGGNLGNLILMRQAAKGRYLTSAVRSFMEDPFGTWDAIAAKSSVMRYRVTSLNREAREKFRQWRHDPGWDTDVARFGMKLISWTDMIGTAPAWLGAYRQAIAEGMSDEQAVRHADGQVTRIFGSGHVEDLPALLRAKGLLGIFTMFSTFMVAQGNTMLDVVSDARQAWRSGELRRKIPELAAQGIAGYIGLAILGELLSGRGPDDDEEPWEWGLRRLVLMPMEYFPGFRAVANIAESRVRHRGFSFGFSSPVADLLEKTALLPVKIGEAVSGEKPAGDTALDVAEVVSTWRGLPTAQAKKTGQYLWHVYTGREHPESFAEFLAGTLYGKRRRR